MTRTIVEDRLRIIGEMVTPEVWEEGFLFAQEGRGVDAGLRHFIGRGQDFYAVCGQCILPDSRIMIPWFRVLENGDTKVGCTCITADNMTMCVHIVALYVHCGEKLIDGNLT